MEDEIHYLKILRMNFTLNWNNNEGNGKIFRHPFSILTYLTYLIKFISIIVTPLYANPYNGLIN